VLLCRASLICGKLPAEEMRDLRSKLTKQMDVLNHMLELDLVVRYRALYLFCWRDVIYIRRKLTKSVHPLPV
jgi:hypothetical protein